MTNITRDDAGTYQCLPRNTVGVGVADTVVLLVEGNSDGNNEIELILVGWKF